MKARVSAGARKRASRVTRWTPAIIEREKRRLLNEAGFRDIELGTGELLTYEHGARSERTAADIELSTEHAHAARVVLQDRRLTPKQRRIWRTIVDGGTWRDAAAQERCSLTVVRDAVDLAKKCMLRPEERVSNTTKRKSGKAKKASTFTFRIGPDTGFRTNPDVDAPTTARRREPEPRPPVSVPAFASIEDTLALSADVCHRLICMAHGRGQELETGDVINMQRATETLLSIRKDEREYMKKAGPPNPPAGPDVVKTLPGMQKPEVKP